MEEILNLLKKYTDGKQNTEKVEISVLQLNRIIKALEQEPCDAISRQAVIDEMYKRKADGDAITVGFIKNLQPVNSQMIEQWQELKETIIEMRDNDGTGTQQEACKFLANYMDVLEKQMPESYKNIIGKE